MPTIRIHSLNFCISVWRPRGTQREMMITALMESPTEMVPLSGESLEV